MTNRSCLFVGRSAAPPVPAPASTLSLFSSGDGGAAEEEGDVSSACNAAAVIGEVADGSEAKM